MIKETKYYKTEKEFKSIVDNTRHLKTLSKDNLEYIFENAEGNEDYLFEAARSTAKTFYGNQIYIRGLIEFTDYCKNDCYYCGIRCSNSKAERYRLTDDEILSCCDVGEKLGFKTFVLQGGEDPFFTDGRICDLIRKIKDRHP